LTRVSVTLQVDDGLVSSFTVRACRNGAVLIRSVDDDHSGGMDAAGMLRGAVTQLACQGGYLFARSNDSVIVLRVTEMRTLVPHDRVAVPVEGGIVHMHVTCRKNERWMGRHCWRRAHVASELSAGAVARTVTAGLAPEALFLLDKFGRTVTLELDPVLHWSRVRG
jgi:hypothetical protein